MSPTEQELLPTFQEIFLEVLVPLSVQSRIPRVRQFWKEITETESGHNALIKVFETSLRSSRSVSETVKEEIDKQDPSVLDLKNRLYEKVAGDETMIRTLMDRPVTNGNEQCPYWAGFRYRFPPKFSRSLN